MDAPLNGKNTVNDLIDRINDLTVSVDSVTTDAILGPGTTVPDKLVAFADTTGKLLKQASNVSDFAYTILDDVNQAAMQTTLGIKSAGLLDATPNNTANQVVQRDSSGNFSANLISSAVRGQVSREFYPGAAGLYHWHDVAGYINGGASVTGTMKITLPVGWTNTMMSIIVRGYNHVTPGGAYEYTLSGYNVASAWSKPQVLASGNVPTVLPIRFGFDGTKACILIGDVTTSWGYPRLAITDVITSHTAANVGWDAGWVIAPITDETGITVSGTAYPNTVVHATSLEVGKADGSSGFATIDFHGGATRVDYDARIGVNQGTGVLGGGTMSIYSSYLNLKTTAFVSSTTPAVDTNDTQVATTAYVLGQGSTANPPMDGVAAPGTSLRFSKADHVHPSDTTKAPLASPALTGTPTAPTAAAGINTTQVATTAYVIGQAATVVSPMDGVAAVGTSTRFARQDHVHTSDTTKVNTSTLGVANGVATLDATGLVPTTQLPAYVDDVLEFANLAAFPATGATGKIYVALDTNKTYRWSGSVYIYITSGAVDSVAGKTGVVTLVKADVGLGSVDNTTDANKPVSTAQQTALNLKANLASPTFTGVPLAPTATGGTSTTQVATTAFVQDAVGGYLALPLAGGVRVLTADEAANATINVNGALTSDVTIEIPVSVSRMYTVANNTTGAFALYVRSGPTGTTVPVTQAKRNVIYTNAAGAHDAFNDFESIALTGTPTAPTASLNTATTQVATTAYVTGQAATVVSPMDGTAAVGTSLRYARQDHVHASDTSRLPLSGGTMTGDLVINKGSAALTLKGAEAGNANVTYMAFTDSAGARDGYVGVASPSTRNVYITADAGDVILNPTLGSSLLYDAGSVKLETTPTGVTVTGTVVATAFTGVASSATTLTGLTPTVAELNYMDGVTSGVQTQLGAKAPLASPALTGTPTAPTATAGTNTTQIASTAYTVAEIGSRAPTKAGVGASGTWGISITGNAATATTLTGLTPTVAELNYVDGVTSSIQTQLNAKAPLASPALTGTPTVPTAVATTNTTQAASTAFVQSQKTTSATDTTSERVWRTNDLVKTTTPTDATAGRLTKVGDFGVGGMLDLRGTIFVTGKPQDLYTKGSVKGFADGGPAGLAIPGIVGIAYGVLELNAHWSEPSGAGGIMRSFTQGGTGVVYTQTMANATTWGPWIATWNTSNLVKTASATDTTLGSVLKVGDFGVGLPIYTTNLNTITGTGLFTCGDHAAAPGPSYLGWWVYQIDAGAGAWKNQTAWQQGNPAAQYVRSSGDGTTWGAWVPVVVADSPAFTGTPTAPTAVAGTNTTQLATTEFVLANGGIGAGQTWQSVIGSRALSTTYTNSTGRPIAISVSTTNGNSQNLTLIVNGVNVVTTISGGSASQGGVAFAIVPAEGTYRATCTHALTNWTELR